MKMTEYEQQLLEGWEEVFKKGQLTLWIMLALKDGPKHMAEIKEFTNRLTRGIVAADDQSMYRALRRYHDAELVLYGLQPGQSGPDRKIYRLTTLGGKLLSSFLGRNIALFYQKEVKTLIERSTK